jgi:hypothetical protein
MVIVVLFESADGQQLVGALQLAFKTRIRRSSLNPKLEQPAQLRQAHAPWQYLTCRAQPD